nr:MAG: RNA-dependent RNA polymerase [Sanya narna-like virus 4]
MRTNLVRREYALQNLIKEGVISWADVPEKNADFRPNSMGPEVKSAWRRHYNADDSLIPGLAAIPSVGQPSSKREIFQKVIRAVPGKLECRIAPIVHVEGNIGVATFQTSEVVWLARALSAFLIPHIKRLHVARDVLHNRRVRLQNTDPSAVIYSADLSKSTDPISIALSRHVLNRVVDNIAKNDQIPEYVRPAIRYCMGAHTIDQGESNYMDRRTITCGALMGLGPGWSVLCILNSFAAWRAGASKESFNICGDDLVGLWTDDVQRGYERNLELLGLAINRQKTLIGRLHGVFCERLVTRESLYTAVGEPTVRMAEALGTRARAKQKGLVIQEFLSRLKNTHPVLRRHAWRLARQHSPSAAPGRLSQGGGGAVRSDAATVISYLLNGPTSLFASERVETITQIRQQLNALPTERSGQRGAGVPVETVLARARGVLERDNRLLRNHLGSKPRPLSYKDIRRDISQRRARAILELKSSKPIRCIRNLVQNQADRPLYVHIDKDFDLPLLRSHMAHRRFDAAIGLLQKQSRRQVSAHAAEAILSATLTGYTPPLTLQLEARVLPVRGDSPAS